MLSPRGKSGLEATSASKLWPWPGLDLVVSLCNRAFFGHKSCKIREFCHFFPAIILSSMLLIIIWYFFVIIFGLGLDLIVLASASSLWPRPRGFGLV